MVKPVDLRPYCPPVSMARSQVPTSGARVWPGLDSSAAVPNMRADTACFLRCMTQSSSTRSLITRFRSLHVPSVNTRLLEINTPNRWLRKYCSFPRSLVIFNHLISSLLNYLPENILTKRQFNVISIFEEKQDS